MIIKELLTALLIATIMVTAFLLLIRSSGTQYGKLWLFLIVFVATWAGGVWIHPLGPPIGGVYWLTFALAGIIAVGLIGLFTPQPTAPRPLRDARKTGTGQTEQRAAAGDDHDPGSAVLGGAFNFRSCHYFQICDTCIKIPSVNQCVFRKRHAANAMEIDGEPWRFPEYVVMEGISMPVEPGVKAGAPRRPP